MTPAQTAALVVVAIWLGLVTLVLVLVVRQVALLMARVERGDSSVPLSPMPLSQDGLQIGSTIPREVLDTVPEANDEVVYLLVLSSTCGPCRELVPKLERHTFAQPMVAIVPGPAEAANEFLNVLPPYMRVVVDPEATAIANMLEVESTPFAMEVESGVVTGKAYLHEDTDLVNLIDARASSDARDVAQAMKEVKSHVH